MEGIKRQTLSNVLYQTPISVELLSFFFDKRVTNKSTRQNICDKH